MKRGSTTEFRTFPYHFYTTSFSPKARKPMGKFACLVSKMKYESLRRTGNLILQVENCNIFRNYQQTSSTQSWRRRPQLMRSLTATRTRSHHVINIEQKKLFRASTTLHQISHRATQGRWNSPFYKHNTFRGPPRFLVRFCSSACYSANRICLRWIRFPDNQSRHSRRGEQNDARNKRRSFSQWLWRTKYNIIPTIRSSVTSVYSKQFSADKSIWRIWRTNHRCHHKSILAE